jgi:hypothetical protein
MLLLLEKKLVRSKEVLQKIDIVSLFGCQFAAIVFAWTSVSKESPFKIQVAPLWPGEDEFETKSANPFSIITRFFAPCDV